MPGLLPPRSGEAGETAAETAATDAPATAAEDATADAGTAADAGTPEAATAVEAAAPEPPASIDEDDPESSEELDRGEPLFEVSDRRATILADKVGIVFRLDEEEADFTWDEIGAVEIDTPRFGKRFKVTVYTGPRRWFEAHVEAKSRGLLKTWTAELDAVLDEHFEDPDAAKDAAKEAEEPAEDATEAAEALEAADAADADETADKAEDAEETDADDTDEAEPAGKPAGKTGTA